MSREPDRRDAEVPRPVGAAEVEPKSGLGDDATLLLLSIAAVRPEGAFEPLCARLRRPDGAEWLLASIDAVFESAGFSAARSADPKEGLERLRRLKDLSKSRLVGPDSGPEASEERLLGLLGYAVAVALSIGLHRRWISSGSRREWDAAFSDLAELAPMPWSAHFAAAVGR